MADEFCNYVNFSFAQIFHFAELPLHAVLGVTVAGYCSVCCML